MSYNVLDVRIPEDRDGLFYPVMGNGPAGVELEELDGDVQQLRVSAMSLRQLKDAQGHTRDIMQPLRDRAIDLLVTDSRVAVACEDWAQSDTHYIGFGLGASVATLNNKWNEMVAKRRARGTMLLGQVRHQWLRAVGFEPRKSLISPGKLRLVTSDRSNGSSSYFFLDLETPKGVDTSEVAQAIAQRAAHYWLDQSEIELDDLTRERLDKLARGSAIPANPNGYASYTMPIVKFAHPEDALPPQLIK